MLVLERETKFRDRVRSEGLVPWGVAEARELGIADLLLNSCALQVPWMEMGLGPRNLTETTPQKEPFFTYYHPEMQEALLGEAENSGARVRRGVIVESVKPGEGVEPGAQGDKHASLTARNGKTENISARLVVGVDGRGSAVRRWGSFAVEKLPLPFQFAGVQLAGVASREDMATFIVNPELGMIAVMIPQTKNRWRCYLGYPTGSGLAFQGSEKLGSFIRESARAVPLMEAAYAEVECTGPLAAFEVSESWVRHPYRHGVALLGDAAATSAPPLGKGWLLRCAVPACCVMPCCAIPIGTRRATSMRASTIAASRTCTRYAAGSAHSFRIPARTRSRSAKGYAQDYGRFNARAGPFVQRPRLAVGRGSARALLWGRVTRTGARPDLHNL